MNSASETGLSTKQFCKILKDYINHKKILSKNSDWYRNINRILALEKCTLWILTYINKAHIISQSQLAWMVVINENNLRNILPCPRNDSFKSSEETFKLIMETANTMAQKKKAA